MTPSQFDPLAGAPRSFGHRLARKLGKTVEPMAVHLLAWCRSLNHRVESIEARLDAAEAQTRSASHAADQAARAFEALADRLRDAEGRGRAAEAKVAALETRADQAYWGREALVERLNRDDARRDEVDGLVAGRLDALEARAEQLFWGREALVERLNRDDARDEVRDRDIEAIRARVDDHLPLPLAFGLDYLAMGRRLAAIEDQIEALLASRPGADSATLVPFPAPGRDQAAG